MKRENIEEEKLIAIKNPYLRYQCDEQNEAFCNNILMIVNTFVNDTNYHYLVSFIGYKLPSDSGDPKGLKLYILWIAKFGYDASFVTNGKFFGKDEIESWKR
ncbi:13861_t:CDS:2 [Ambispora leptoticha]|uniref:13861_t:CDS:1 n=1 Tax=Ambispora leptoticha TaxID=144679 RepID=A0A9N8WQB7_9GLOM|nr:13861_t:CDS:2 [Ambispora leptoticha]